MCTSAGPEVLVPVTHKPPPAFVAHIGRLEKILARSRLVEGALGSADLLATMTVLPDTGAAVMIHPAAFLQIAALDRPFGDCAYVVSPVSLYLPGDCAPVFAYLFGNGCEAKSFFDTALDDETVLIGQIGFLHFSSSSMSDLLWM